MERLFLFLFVISFSAFATFIDFPLYEEGALEKKSMEVPEEYQEIAQEVYELFDEEVRLQGGKLKIEFNMRETKINAYADRKTDYWRITFTGGLIRHKLFNKNLFASVLCHELGHHIAGPPYKSFFLFGPTWASAEGQSDYFATNICLKRLYMDKNNTEILGAEEINPFIDEACRLKDPRYYDLCVRNTLISEETGRMLAILGSKKPIPEEKMPKLNTPDSNQVSRVFTKHPKAQCRMDTYFQGSLCESYFLVESEQKGVKNCEDKWDDLFSGARPRCWYAKR